jgi:predicted fused transcriptional regulator/phosphomethylpyrimidine kinase/predicted transcriptional regulator
MKFIEEVVVDEFLPTFRAMLAEALRDRGLTQREVATALGVSQSAVSKYAHGDVTTRSSIAADDRVRDLVERIADGLVEGEMSRIQALAETEILIRRLESQGDLLADLHAESMPGLEDFEVGRGIHDPESDVRARERTLASVRRGLRLLETTAGAATLVPDVGSNLVECLPGATDIADVAAVPGRLVDVKGRIEVPAAPEFGVSGHVATVLLAARAGGADATAALNIRYESELIETLEAAGHESVQFAAETDDLATTIEEALTAQPSARVLYQTGGFGVEPVLYILGSDAEAVVRTVRELV